MQQHNLLLKKKTYKCLSYHYSKVAFKYQVVYHSASDHIYVNRNRRKHKEEDLNLQRPRNKILFIKNFVIQ